MAPLSLFSITILAVRVLAALPPPAVGLISIDTNPDVGLQWQVNVSAVSYPPGNNGAEYRINTTQSLVWSSNQTLNQLVNTIWEASPSGQAQNLSATWFLWDSVPYNLSSKWQSGNGSCLAVLGSDCVQAVLGTNVGDAFDAFKAPQCNSTLGAISPGSRGTFEGKSIATPQNFTNSSLPIGLQGLGGIESSRVYNSSNLTALYQSEGLLQMLLLQGLPEPVLTCQIANISALRHVSAATINTIGSHWMMGLLVAITMLVLV